MNHVAGIRYIRPKGGIVGMFHTSEKLGHRVCTRSALLVAPLGMPLVIDAPSEDVLDLVKQACCDWKGDIDPDARTLHLTMQPTEWAAPCSSGGIQINGSQISVSGSGMEGGACAQRGAAWCRLNDPTKMDALRLREEVLDPLILFLMTRNGRVPIHASAFLVGDLAVVLAGPSGTGKSCLALAARRAGLPVLSDDIVYVQLEPVLRVWGMPQHIHVFAQDLPAGVASKTRLRNGKLKHGIAIGNGTIARVAQRVAVCLMQPGAAVAIDVIAPEDVALKGNDLEPGFDLLACPIEAALERLTANGAIGLTLSSDPDAAIRCLLLNHSLLNAVCS